MEKVLGGIAQLGRVPAALFIIDIGHEHIALAEAKRLGISTFGMVDTNCDPNKVDFSIPANDDATKSIAIITNYITAAIAEGLAERQNEKAEEEETEEVVERGPRFDIDEAGGEREKAPAAEVVVVVALVDQAEAVPAVAVRAEDAHHQVVAEPGDPAVQVVEDNRRAKLELLIF